MKREIECKRCGFTLIELLVVVAIIAILAAILVPAVSSALDRARGTLCLSNQKQIATATSMYMLEHNDNMVYFHWEYRMDPPCPIDYSEDLVYPDPRGAWWMDLLNSYVESVPVFNCPGVKSQAYVPGLGADSGRFFGIGMSYPEFGAWKARGAPDVTRNLNDYPLPTETVIFADSGLVTNPSEPNPDNWEESSDAPGFIYVRCPTDNGWYNSHPVRPVPRHGGLTSAVFLDGHAASVQNSFLGWHLPEKDPGNRWDRY